MLLDITEQVLHAENTLNALDFNVYKHVNHCGYSLHYSQKKSLSLSDVLHVSTRLPRAPPGSGLLPLCAMARAGLTTLTAALRPAQPMPSPASRWLSRGSIPHLHLVPPSWLICSHRALHFPILIPSPPSWLICSQRALHFPSHLASISANSNGGNLT